MLIVPGAAAASEMGSTGTRPSSPGAAEPPWRPEVDDETSDDLRIRRRTVIGDLRAPVAERSEVVRLLAGGWACLPSK